MEWWIILGIAASASIDNLGAGISYGVRNIRINLLANSIIAGIGFLFALTGLLFGQWLSQVLPGILPTLFAALLLGVIGLRIILLSLPREEKGRVRAEARERSLPTFTKILEEPELADLDASGDISWWEAVPLGIALSPSTP